MCGVGRQLGNGDIRVNGINTDTFKAGHIEMVDLRPEWRAGCADGWDEQDACRQLFQGSGIKFLTANNV